MKSKIKNEKQARALCAKGQRIGAIKLLRDSNPGRFDLKTAKDLTDEWLAEIARDALRAKRKEGYRFFVTKPDGSQEFHVTAPIYYTTRMQPGERLDEISPFGNAIEVFTKPARVAVAPIAQEAVTPDAAPRMSHFEFEKLVDVACRQEPTVSRLQHAAIVRAILRAMGKAVK